MVVRIVEILLQCICRKFLAHTRTIQNAAAVMVNEGGSIDASRVRVAENHVHTLSLQAAFEVLCVGTCRHYGQYLFFQRSGYALVCNLFLRPCETLLNCLVADRRPDFGSLERIANLVAVIIGGRIDQSVILTVTGYAPCFLHIYII